VELTCLKNPLHEPSIGVTERSVSAYRPLVVTNLQLTINTGMGPISTTAVDNMAAMTPLAGAWGALADPIAPGSEGGIRGWLGALPNVTTRWAGDAGEEPDVDAAGSAMRRLWLDVRMGTRNQGNML